MRQQLLLLSAGKLSDTRFLIVGLREAVKDVQHRVAFKDLPRLFQRYPCSCLRVLFLSPEHIHPVLADHTVKIVAGFLALVVLLLGRVDACICTRQQVGQRVLSIAAFMSIGWVALQMACVGVLSRLVVQKAASTALRIGLGLDSITYDTV